MALIKKNLTPHYWGGVGGTRVWTYLTTDPVATVTAANYFADSDVLPSDVMLLQVVDNPRNPTAVTFSSWGRVGAGTFTSVQADTAALTLLTAI